MLSRFQGIPKIKRGEPGRRVTLMHLRVVDFKASTAHARFEMELEFLLQRHKRQSLQFGYSQVGAESLQLQRAGTVSTLSGRIEDLRMRARP